MDAGLQSSIYPVESNREGDNIVGTGFLICQDKQISYFLTCAHVVESIGDDYLQINGMAATVQAIGASNDLDLAVLAVPGFSSDSVAELINMGSEGDPITITGIYDYGQHRSRKSIRGYLGLQSSLKKPKTQSKWIKAWELKLETAEYLQPGYSGSPVVHDTSRKVIAVVSHRRGQGDRGLAISVEALNELWQQGTQPTWARALLKSRNEQPRMSDSAWEVEHIHRQIDSLEKTWDSLTNKIEKLQLDSSHETQSNVLDQLEYVISKTKAQRDKIDEEIRSLRAELRKLET